MPKEIFKITSAGSVDDGKSTILARLLLDTGSILVDQLSKNFDPNKIADLLDGLESEREQGITIDVAYRFFDSKNRRYQMADSPGHEQYTRNMATACAGSDALLLVVDSQTGLKHQTKHHLEIALRLGLREIIFAINKMDLVGYSKKAFEQIKNQIDQHVDSRSGHFENITQQVIPVSGLTGANIIKSSSRLSWFEGPTLMSAMDELTKPDKQQRDALFQVQYIQRLSGGGRRYLGQVIAGEIQLGQKLTSNQKSFKLTKIFVSGEEATKAQTNDPISIEMDKELDINRGDVFSERTIAAHDQFEVDLIWLSEHKGQKSRKYILKSGSDESTVSISKINQISLETDQKTGERQTVDVNQIIRANITASKPLALEPFTSAPELGRFVLIDPVTGQTIAVGTVNFALRRSKNITKHDFKVTSEQHGEITGNKGQVIWFTGLSGSGKSTLANQLSFELYKESKPHFVLDGDNLRCGINKDLGFTEGDRTENIRRTAEIASLMADAGLIVLVAVISPFEQDRELARETIGESRFTLVFVDTPLEVCEQRDPKGLYKKARAGEIPNFTGIGSGFEPPKEALRAQSIIDLEPIYKFL